VRSVVFSANWRTISLAVVDGEPHGDVLVAAAKFSEEAGKKSNRRR